MVWPTSWEGVAIGGNVRSNAHEGQSQRYQFMKRATAISHTSFRDRHAGTARVATAEARFPPNLPNASLHTGREAAMPHPTWQDLYNAAFLEVDLAKLRERVEAACRNSSIPSREGADSYCGRSQGA